VTEPVLLREWERRELPGYSLDPLDRALAGELGRGRRLRLDDLRDGLRVGARQWVGVVRFESGFELRVEPKLAGTKLDLVGMIRYALGIDALVEHAGVRELDAAGGGLVDLIALLFVREADRVVRRGLVADYVEHEDELPLLRGRLLVREQLVRRAGRPDLLHCRFDERTHDIFDNRLLGAAAEACARIADDEAIRRRASVVRDTLAEVSDWSRLNLRVAGAARPSYDRLNNHYRTAHQLAQLLLRALGPQDLLARGATRSFVFLLDMNTLFEEFVARLVAELAGRRFRVLPQRRDWSIIRDAATNRPYARIVPDVLVVDPASGSRRAVDAKYKLYGEGEAETGDRERKVSVDDIAQLFLYAYAYAADADTPESVLVHPSSTPQLSCRRLTVRSPGTALWADVNTVGLPIPRVLAELAAGDGPTLRELRPILLASPSLRPEAAGALAS
jgi:5-methylcytosine-specific restriction enzyme subunit McrC